MKMSKKVAKAMLIVRSMEVIEEEREKQHLSTLFKIADGLGCWS